LTTSFDPSNSGFTFISLMQEPRRIKKTRGRNFMKEYQLKPGLQTKFLEVYFKLAAFSDLV